MRKTPLDTPANSRSSLLRKLPIKAAELFRFGSVACPSDASSGVRRVRAMGKAYVTG